MTASMPIPKSRVIVAEAVAALGLPQMAHKDVRARFDELMGALMKESLRRYEAYENSLYGTRIAGAMVDDNPAALHDAESVGTCHGFRAGVLAFIESVYPELRRAFLSVSQGRKARGGSSFEDSFAELLKCAGYSHVRQNQGTRTDFILPSAHAFERNRIVCAVASLKRTLRERWQEVVGELKQLNSPSVYLVTADDHVGAGHVEGICEVHSLHLVVRDAVKQQYPNHPLVLGFTEFAGTRLAQHEAQWTNAGLM